PTEPMLFGAGDCIGIKADPPLAAAAEGVRAARAAAAALAAGPDARGRPAGTQGRARRWGCAAFVSGVVGPGFARGLTASGECGAPLAECCQGLFAPLCLLDRHLPPLA